jgi:putative copper export protein
MFAKHLAFGVMVALAVYQTWVLAPALERQTLRRAAQGEPEEGSALAPQRRMLRLNFWMGMVILLLTAIARTA